MHRPCKNLIKKNMKGGDPVENLSLCRSVLTFLKMKGEVDFIYLAQIGTSDIFF
jgi:DNA-binding Xre family transcriptional regulator